MPCGQGPVPSTAQVANGKTTWRHRQCWEGDGQIHHFTGGSAASCGLTVAAHDVSRFSPVGASLFHFGVQGHSPGQLRCSSGHQWRHYHGRWWQPLGQHLFPGEQVQDQEKSRLPHGPQGSGCRPEWTYHCGWQQVSASSPYNSITSWSTTLETVEPLMAGPHFVAMSKNEIVVMNCHNHSVKVDRASRELLFKFGSQRQGNGKFSAPTGIAVASNGNIL